MRPWGHLGPKTSKPLTKSLRRCHFKPILEADFIPKCTLWTLRFLCFFDTLPKSIFVKMGHKSIPKGRPGGYILNLSGVKPENVLSMIVVHQTSIFQIQGSRNYSGCGHFFVSRFKEAFEIDFSRFCHDISEFRVPFWAPC